MSDKAPKLLPCPFCGSPADQKRTGAIMCSNIVCRVICGVPANDLADGYDPTVVWNTRPTPSEPVAQGVRFREESDETIARRLATIEHGDDAEWKGFITRAHHWMSLTIDAIDPVAPTGPERSVALVREALQAAQEYIAKDQLHFSPDETLNKIAIALHALPPPLQARERNNTMEKGNDILSERLHKPSKRINVNGAIRCSLMILLIIVSLTGIYFILSLMRN